MVGCLTDVSNMCLYACGGGFENRQTEAQIARLGTVLSVYVHLEIWIANIYEFQL